MIRAFANKHWTLERDTEQLLLVVRRTDAPYLAIGEIAKSFTELETAIERYNRKHFALLIDMRAAPRRNDPEYEREASHQPGVLSRGFLRCAVLVATPSGMLQVGRHIRSLQLKIEVFSDEIAAMEYLLPPRSIPPASTPPRSAPRSG